MCLEYRFCGGADPPRECRLRTEGYRIYPDAGGERCLAAGLRSKDFPYRTKEVEILHLLLHFGGDLLLQREVLHRIGNRDVHFIFYLHGCNGLNHLLLHFFDSERRIPSRDEHIDGALPALMLLQCHADSRVAGVRTAGKPVAAGGREGITRTDGSVLICHLRSNLAEEADEVVVRRLQTIDSPESIPDKRRLLRTRNHTHEIAVRGICATADRIVACDIDTDEFTLHEGIL